MAFCTQCGEKFGEEHQFCSSCGAPKLIPSEQTPSVETEPEKTEEFEDVHDAVVAEVRATPEQKGVGVGGAATFALVSLGLLFAVLLGTGGFGGSSSEGETPSSASAPPPKAAPEPIEVETWDNDISREDCALVVEQTRYLSSLYSGDSFTGSGQDLNSAADVFTRISGSYAGSDRDWLLKMAELSDRAAQGFDLPAKQLKANLGLVEQFCG